jgi:predicted ATP-dependent protease
MQEMIEEGTILIDTEGMVGGQVNGISVLSLGDYVLWQALAHYGAHLCGQCRCGEH